mmetsp:Transcript_124946/g.296473  ORF Transcript_124946/g.296473 Transcript_124946/m.296473 type:complete len:118 (-) Transcript_124946:103-456(-)
MGQLFTLCGSCVDGHRAEGGHLQGDQLLFSLAVLASTRGRRRSSRLPRGDTSASRRPRAEREKERGEKLTEPGLLSLAEDDSAEPAEVDTELSSTVSATRAAGGLNFGHSGAFPAGA